MRYLLAVLLALAMACPAVSQVTQLEYFVDTDPGYGMATAIPVTTGTDIFKTYTLPLSSVSEGFHIVSFRAKDAQGHWSHITSHTFYVLPGVAASVTTSEYYIDTDPGYGNGISVPGTVGSDSSLKFIVPLSSYATGFHTIGLRSKDDQGRWSQTYQHAFYVTGNNTAVNITALQYYFVADTTISAMYTYPIPTPSVNVNLNFTADLSNLPGDKLYDMHIWAINAEGIRSEVLIKKVKVCSGAVAKAKFDFVQSGNQVSFIDNSSGGIKYSWNFGDGKTDSVSNPLHTYTTVGNYTVKLVVVNFCNSDTITKTVSVVGLKDIITNHGGNTGNVSVSITGAGFVPGMQLYMHKTGQQDITGDTLIVQTVGSISTTFNLTGKAVGLWDVIAAFPDGKRDTLHSGFTIEDGNEPKLWVNITGDGVLRIGFNQVYTVTYGNKGNTDARFVPLIISGLPMGTEIEILNPLFKIDSLQGFDTLHLSSYKLKRTINDTSLGTSFRAFYIGIIPASFTGTLSFVFHLPLTATLHSYPKIAVYLGNSSTTQSHHNHVNRVNAEDPYDEQGKECLKEVAKVGFFEVVADYANLEPSGVASCIVGGVQLIDGIYDILTSKPGEKTKFDKVIDMSDLFATVAIAALPCTRAALNIAALSQPELIPEVAEVDEILLAEEKAAQRIDDAFQKTFDKVGSKISIAAELNACTPFLKSFAVNYIFPIIGNAWDPNQKYGTGDASVSHYTTDNPLTYVINFENDPAANLNAQTVTVLDTLNANYYDLKSFGFTSVTIGDSVFSLGSPVKSLVHDFDFTSLYGVKARVTAKFDTATGVAQWKFLTIDPTTNQVTSNALAGFLPPDKISPKGQGYVSYTVNPNPNIQTGDTANNKATIIFDYNPPITTNYWQNVFDLIKPASRIQSLPAEMYDTTFQVHWSGTDNASGIRSYDIYYAINNGPFQLWLSDVAATDSSFTGKVDSTYRFFSIAKDNAGNIEDTKTTGETYTHIIGSALPVSLVSFNAHIAGNNTILNWVTASEQNSSYFNLERSTDGVNFTTIATIKAAGSSNTSLNYSYVDSNVARLHTDEIYYRLQQVDKNGKYKFTPVIKVSIVNQVFTVNILPNPVLDYVNLQIAVDKVQPIAILITDASGRTLINDKKSMTAGTNSKSYNTASWSTGIYIIRITKADGTSKTFRIVKQ